MEFPTVLVLLAPGAEEMEAIIVIDVLRRASMTVTIAGIESSEPVTCSRNVVVVPDCDLSSVLERDFDVIVLPGGAAGAQCAVYCQEV